MDRLKRAIDFAHQEGTRIFLTLNTIMTDNEIDYLYHNLKGYITMVLMLL